MQKKLKTFSIITPVLNNKDKLIKNIKSIKKQKFQDYEIIVVDGGSNDGAKEYLDSEKTISKIIIENDRGIYDAINKGIKISEGKYINTINASIDIITPLFVGWIIFDSIFKRNVRNFGSLSYDSKVELLATEGTGQIDVMLAYTLFGDPAMQLAIADYETQPRLANRTTAPGEILKVEGGQIFRIDYDAKKRQKNYYPLTDFSYSPTIVESDTYASRLKFESQK